MTKTKEKDHAADPADPVVGSPPVELTKTDGPAPAKPEPKVHKVMHRGQLREIIYTSQADLDKSLKALAEPEPTADEPKAKKVKSG